MPISIVEMRAAVAVVKQELVAARSTLNTNFLVLAEEVEEMLQMGAMQEGIVSMHHQVNVYLLRMHRMGHWIMQRPSGIIN